jgi:hypothetical protein
MSNAENDNEPLQFQSLAAITARVLQSNEKQNEQSTDDRKRGDGNQPDDSERRRYVDRRLRELAAFERQANGGVRPKRRPDR